MHDHQRYCIAIDRRVGLCRFRISLPCHYTVCAHPTNTTLNPMLFNGWLSCIVLAYHVTGDVPIKTASASEVTFSLVTSTPVLCSATLCSVEAVIHETTTPVSVCVVLIFNAPLLESTMLLGTANPGRYAATILAANAWFWLTTSTKSRDKWQEP